MLAAAPAAAAATTVDQTAQCLRSQPVCGSVSAAERASLTREIDSSGAAPIFIAVLPSGSAEAAVNQIHDRLQKQGTYVAVAGHSLFAKATDFHAGPLASAAVAAHRGDGRLAVLEDFIDRVGQEQSAGAPPSAGGGGGSGSGSSGSLPLILLGAIGLGGGALFLNTRRQTRRREERELAEVKKVARDDLVALGDDIRDLDIDVEMPGVDRAAKADYGRAVQSYDRANALFEGARRPS